MKATHRTRLLLVAVLGAVLLAVGGWWAVGDPFATEQKPAWQTIEHDGVRVIVPGDWERADMDDCEFELERWIPPGASPCRSAEGLAFYGSATFDPRHGPGIRPGREMDPDAATWAGYVYAGEYAVYASTEERATLEKMLGSARTQ